MSFLARWARVRRWVQACRTERCACGGPLHYSFGLAGGGYGPYFICERCSLIHKSLAESED